MTFSEYLKEQFGIGEPIFIEKIKYGGFSGVRVVEELEKLADSDELRRFDPVVYYFPRMMSYGEGCIAPRKVIAYRFCPTGTMFTAILQGSTF